MNILIYCNAFLPKIDGIVFRIKMFLDSMNNNKNNNRLEDFVGNNNANRNRSNKALNRLTNKLNKTRKRARNTASKIKNTTTDTVSTGTKGIDFSLLDITKIFGGILFRRNNEKYSYDNRSNCFCYKCCFC